ncbi:MAG: translational GTPase TypA [Patescibacteria group bacterium]|nr:translational GTPase TypA [Patescibacteria group bacterium]
MTDPKIRNVAIIAHIDHGKTTLVDFLLKQSHTFRDNAQELSQTLIMDSNELERERGITILAKNNAIHYKGYKINIIDTPGHADFGGEVERTLNMAEGCLLLVDAQEGPMPQTRFVLQRALELDLTPIVIINKIDKPARRIPEVIEEIGSLFLELARHERQLEFPVIYAIGREGKAFEKLPESPEELECATLEPLFEKIIAAIPPPQGDPALPFQMRVTALDYDDFKGSYAIGKITRGTAHVGMPIALIDSENHIQKGRIVHLYTWEGLTRKEVERVQAGDIVALAGLEKIAINTTICAAEHPEALTPVDIEEPTLRILVGANTSPFVGQDGTQLTARQLRERLRKELETNVSLRMEVQGERFLLSGRGELHLSILLETLRREGFELEVGKPTVVTKVQDGKTLEPCEEVLIDAPDEYRGTILSEMAKRKATLNDTYPHASAVRFIYAMSTRTLLGLRNVLTTLTHGSFTLSSRFLYFAPQGEPPQKTRGGALIAHESGKTLAYGLATAQGRGNTFVEPGTTVYEGMIIGVSAKEEDIEINVCKGKELTNMRSKGSDHMIQLAPALVVSLEKALDFIEDDELLEITPKNLRLRKKHLAKVERSRHKK